MADTGVYPGSRIAHLPWPLKPLAIALRAKVDDFGTRAYHHQQDGLCTANNVDFMRDPAFVSAYARSVRAANNDFGIPYRVHQALWCAATAPEGCFVELGTGRGFIMSAVMSQHPNREAHLFDSFDPHYIATDGTQTGAVSGYYATSFEDVANNFAEWPSVRLHRGDIFETLPNANLESIAFAHVDLNHAAVEAFGIRQLWPRMAQGAILLLDDYAHKGHDTQYAAMNTVAAELGFALLSTASGQGIAVKQA